MKHICRCQDSKGVVCGKPMTNQEHRQDGMCSTCADHVWQELLSSGLYGKPKSTTPYRWEHENHPTLP